MKFKIGDKVRIIRNDSTGVIFNIRNNLTSYDVRIEKDTYVIIKTMREDDLELIKEPTLKEKYLELAKTEKLVFMDNYGNKGILYVDMILFDIDGFLLIKNLDENLNFKTYSIHMLFLEWKAYSIEKIYKTKGNTYTNLTNPDNLELIWERKQEIPKYTKEELEKIVGHSFEIKE